MAAAASVIVGASIASCASAAPFNPAGLSGDQLSRVADICQSVMGLHASEPPSGVWGAAVDPRLEPGENHYQGCIASLSNSLRSAGDARGLMRVDDGCRAKGFGSDSPELAECVLQSRQTRSPSSDFGSQTFAATPVHDAPGRGAVGSFFSARPHEATRREQLACARLGLNPAYASFDSCVKDMDDTFYAIENPRD
jgi:hypothetical protein